MKINRKDFGTFLIMLEVIIGGYVLYSQFAINPVSQEFVSWTQAGSEITTAKKDVPVTLYINLHATSPLGYQGIAKIQVKKDVIGTPDVVFITKSVNVNIPAGFGNNKQSVAVTFTPNEATGIIRVREYFYKVFLGERAIYDPQISGDRNGLLVGEKASSGGDPETGIPSVKGILFNGQPQIVIAPNTLISTKVKLIGTGTGIIYVEIRKDIPLLTDGTHVLLQKAATCTNSCEIDMPQWTAQAQGLNFREYFGKVWWNDNLIYDPQSPSEREFVKLSSTNDGGNGGGDNGNTGSVTIKSVKWTTTANSYSKATVTFAITGTVSKTVTADIRQDIPLMTDKNLQSVSINIAGTNTELSYDVGFVAPGAGSWVFLRVQNVYDSTDPSQRKAQGTEVQIGGSVPATPTPTATPTPKPTETYYPPPEEPPAQPGTLTVSNVGFGTNQGSVTVSKGQSVPVYVYVSASGGDVYQQIKLEVRKDIIGRPDTTYKEMYQTIKLRNGQSMWYIVGSFSPDETTSNLWGVRQYFARISIGNSLVYDPQDPNSRPHVTVK